MDANDRSRPELRGSGPSPAEAARAQHEAACRAAHPSSRRPHATPDPSAAAAAAVHYESSAVRWLAEQSDHLDAWPADAAERGAALDAVGDLALLVGVRLRRGSGPLGADYTALVTALGSLAARADTRELLRQEPRALVPLVTVQWALTASGQPDPCLAQTLQMILGDRSVLGVARTPQDQIALHFLLRQAGIDLPCPRLPDLLATSVLADDTVALQLADPELRGLACIILTASEFGASDIPWPAGRTSAGVAGMLQEWLVLAMASEDAGLVGALLAGLSCLRAPWDDLVGSARRWLHGWQESDGRIDGLPVAEAERAALWATWAAAVRATAMTALDGLLMRTLIAPVGVAGAVPAPAAPGATTPALVDSIMAAADWLDAVLPGTHVQGRLGTAEAWLALGDEAEARRQLLRLADDPHLAFTVLKQAPDQAVRLAALVVALEMTSPALVDLCEDVAALLSHPDAARQLFGTEPRREAGGGLAVDGSPGTATVSDLRRRTERLSAALVHGGPRHDPRSREGLDQLDLLARGAQQAVASGDVAWLALTLRGLQRLELAPPRLLLDVAAVLRGRQRPDGAIGARPTGERRSGDDPQVRSTLAALTALVEALPPDLPRAA